MGEKPCGSITDTCNRRQLQMSEKPTQPAIGYGIWVSPLAKSGQGWRRYFWQVGPSRGGDLAILVLRIRAGGGQDAVGPAPPFPAWTLRLRHQKRGQEALLWDGGGGLIHPGPQRPWHSEARPGAPRPPDSHGQLLQQARPGGAVRRVPSQSHLSTKRPETRRDMPPGCGAGGRARGVLGGITRGLRGVGRDPQPHGSEDMGGSGGAAAGQGRHLSLALSPGPSSCLPAFPHSPPQGPARRHSQV